jgi:hypothetical protein
MKFTKEEIDRLAALPDDELWCQVQNIARGYGLNLPNTQPSHAELEKLRGIATGGKISMSEAMMLINKYKRGMGK